MHTLLYIAASYYFVRRSYLEVLNMPRSSIGNTLDMYMSNNVKQIIVCFEVHWCSGLMNPELHLYESSLMGV